MLNFKLLLNKYNDTDILIEALRLEKTAAIEYILKKVEKNCAYYIKKIGLSDESLPDVLHDGLILLIDKIQSGKFDSAQASPQTYMFGICKNLILNMSRSKKSIKAIELEESMQWFEDEINLSIHFKETSLLVQQMLNDLGMPCSQLIQFKYIDGYSDVEQVEQKLTHFSNLDSLRVSRSQCMKKLVTMSLKYKSIYENGRY
ncbi:MAG: hypothetical protein LKG19_11805 [Saprospiraceae bacterium]|jgi:RNA polymerase sigma factor (sigma-70 family)|nr:hypothetical protein [Saprospiraceae bacterium]